MEKYGFDRAAKWYEQKLDGVLENEDSKLLWDFMIQCDRIIQARRPVIILCDKVKMEVKIIDIASPGDSRIRNKEQEKVEKYEELKEDIGRVWNMKKVTVISIVIGALGCISQRFDSCMEKGGIIVQLQVIQKTTLLGTAWMLRKTLSM